MHSLFRSAFIAGAMAGVASLAPGAATAGVSVGIGVGVPAVVIGAGPGYVAYDDQYYYDPIYISGAWYHGPYRWRMIRGERMYFVDGRWHRNEWREGRVPASIVFRNGGSFRDGRYDGFEGAQRINARFRTGGAEMREDRRELNDDRSDLRQDRSELREDRRDNRDDRDDARQNNRDFH